MESETGLWGISIGKSGLGTIAWSRQYSKQQAIDEYVAIKGQTWAHWQKLGRVCIPVTDKELDR